MMQHPAIVPLLLGLLLSVLGLVLCLVKYFQIRSRYSPIIDAEAAIEKAKAEAIQITAEATANVAASKGKIETLKLEYSKALPLYEKLKKEISLLEEDAEAIEHGIYKPHFDLGTSEEYKKKLEANYVSQKTLVKDGNAITCAIEWKVGGSEKEGKKMIKQNTKLMLRAFNGECDAAIAKVTWNNIDKMEERIRKSYDGINEFGAVMSMSITKKYLDVKLDELHLEYELEEKKREEQEEQRLIREQMREEEKVQRELEKARKDAEDEEKKYEKALEKARAEMAKATGEELGALNTKLAELQKQLDEAHQAKERAISQAQLTRAGHVYVISNIGSFGEDVVKIGMTRRLEPLDRIRELGDASVPFEFDIHALVYSEDAPTLENKLHNHFKAKRVNLVNYKKEFFEVGIEEVEDFAKQNNLEISFTKLAEAREYRETVALKESKPVDLPMPKVNDFPATI